MAVAEGDCGHLQLLVWKAERADVAPLVVVLRTREWRVRDYGRLLLFAWGVEESRAVPQALWEAVVAGARSRGHVCDDGGV